MESATNSISTIVFDLGGVLIDWNPRHLYKRIFADEAGMEYFLEEICTQDWNAQQDAGRTLEEATNLLLDQHPQYMEEIKMYYGRWEEMLNGSIGETVDILRHLKYHTQYRLLALTNWSHQTFPRALELFDFLHWFEGVVVSGKEKLKKPDPALYQILFERYRLDPGQSLFVDDSLPNVEAAQALGMQAIHFQDPNKLRQDLIELNITL